MPNYNYVKGRGFEYRIRNWLIRRGYYVVRSYASHGTFDLVAVPAKSSRLSSPLLIQAKYSRKNKVQISSEEKIRLATEARRLQGFCCIVFNENRRIKWKLVNPYYYE
ncbi:MAG: hypothetical protein ACKO7N_05720 [Candidatus Nitrosotenuis sp.]